MKPNLDGSFLQQRMETNAQGLRGPPLSVGKPPGVVRIVGLGDSVMLGWGVSYDDTALTKIGRMVEASVGKWTQTVNTGCPSYNTAVEVAVYRQKGRQYRPDVVVLCSVSERPTPVIPSPKHPVVDKASPMDYTNALNVTGLARSGSALRG